MCTKEDIVLLSSPTSRNMINMLKIAIKNKYDAAKYTDKIYITKLIIYIPTDSHVRIFLRFLMIEQIFFTRQVKRSMVICNRQVFTSCLTSCRTTEHFGSQGIRTFQEKFKTSQKYCLVLCPPTRNKSFVSTSKNLLKNRN